MPHTPTELLSPADRGRRRSLQRMKAVALGALLVMAVLFVTGFVLQERIPAFAYLRAAAEGGMVGALADWFAVTALFRRPMGLPIPHTAIIPTRKDEIGRSLGEFVETNFLSGPIVRGKLQAARISSRLGAWLAQPAHAERVASEGAAMAQGVLRALSDDDVQELVASLARDHLIEPEWGTPAGAWLERLVDTGAHRTAVDLAADNIATWLAANRDAFTGLVSRRLPSWVPSPVHRMIDGALHHEAVAFVDAVRADRRHPARAAIDGYLTRLADNLQHDPVTRARLEQAKEAVFDSPRLRELAARTWETAKVGLLAALEDPQSGLRVRLREALTDIGRRLSSEAALQRRVDGWVVDAAAFLVERYRHDIASIITDTVDRWDPEETTEKIELLVGRDLQYIRLNGTVVGALAGLVIFTIAHAAFG